MNGTASIEPRKLQWFYGISLLYIGSAAVSLVAENFWYLLVPAALAILYLSVFAIDILMYIVVFSTPLAVNLDNKAFGFAFSVPTEPLMFGIMMLFLLKVVREGRFDSAVMKHPVTLAILVNLGWILVTTLTSTMLLVSLKHFLARLWFVIVFYFLGTQLFRSNVNIRRFVWLYLIPLIGVIGYTLVRHAHNGWTQKTAHWVMTPFYNDHTAYAAVIAMFLPVTFALTRNRNYSLPLRLTATLAFLILITAMILSYTRAAWISLAVALAVYIVFAFRIRLSTILLVGGTLFALFFAFRTEITLRLEQNRQQSSTDFNTHLQSISNITTDASNLERINRWHSALRMFRERPFFGWGPGTYQFQYAPFQLSSEKTIISTNAGDRGNAHSEYIGPLAESGVLGAVTFILILLVMLYRAVLLYGRLNDPESRLLLMGILLGLITYIIHGSLNNFLDTDKASVPFWAFVAVLVALDCRHPATAEQNGNGRTGNGMNRIH
jgi:putative inorganic carbon (HCO3(-)) transporter